MLMLVSSGANNIKTRAMIIRSYPLCVFAFVLLAGPMVAIATESLKQVDYSRISKKSDGIGAVRNDEGITILGYKLYMRFEDRVNRTDGNADLAPEDSSGPLAFDGYAQFLQTLPDQSIVIAGLDYKASSLSSLFAKDARRNFILRMNPASLEVEKFLTLHDRVSYGLALDKSNQIVLLSGSERRPYKLTVFDHDLREKRSVAFGIGGKGAIAVTNEGNYIALGFERTKDDLTEYPTLWEYSPGLELISKKTLSDKTKTRTSMSGHMEILRNEEEVYLVYGWDNCSGCKQPGSTALWIEKVKGRGNLWKTDHSYHLHLRSFILPDGNPSVLEPRQDGIYQTVFNKDSGATSTFTLTKPTSSPDCFPRGKFYETVDLLHTAELSDLILSSRPSRCVMIGKVKW